MHNDMQDNHQKKPKDNFEGKIMNKPFPLNPLSTHPALLSDDGASLSYSDINTFSEIIQNQIPTRSLIFCLCQNTIGSLLGYISFINNKQVPLLLNASMDIGFVKNLLDAYRPSFLWLPVEQAQNYEGELVFSSHEYGLLQMKVEKPPLPHEDLALLLTTSGSTGSPKLVRLSYRNILSNAQSIAEYLSIDKNERPITVLPMYYSFGLSVINSHLLKGATILVTNKSLMEKDFWSFLKNEKASSISGVPYTYEMLKRLRLFRMDLPSLQTMTQAGGKLNPERCKDFAEYAQASGKRFVVMYGQTEATARMSYLPPEMALTKAGSIGTAIPDGKFSLIDEYGNPIENNEQTGELIYQGPNVSLGYAESAADLSRGDDNKGILYTGDLAQRDGDGYYYIVGRKKRFIKLFGNRINLDETERIVQTLTGECACIGTDDKMIIYLTQKGIENEVRQLVSSKTNINPSVFEVRTIDAIPKNAAGKTTYSQLSI
jgi:acyl-coenzyme A synthetase/AMP-(fatty) acid ligase